jgi:hypothetical protein
MRVLLVMLLVAIATTAVAQPAPPAAGVNRREKIKQRIRALRAYTLTEQLDLDEPTAAKLFPALAKYDDEFDKLLQERADVQRRLQQAGSLTDTKEIDKLVDDAIANQRALWDAEDRRIKQLRTILTPAQTARVLVVLPEMERKVMTQLRRVAQKADKVPARPQPPATSGELTDNPFARSPEGTIDPFATDRPPGKRPAKKAPCDPFSSKHGC